MSKNKMNCDWQECSEVDPTYGILVEGKTLRYMLYFCSEEHYIEWLKERVVGISTEAKKLRSISQEVLDLQA